MSQPLGGVDVAVGVGPPGVFVAVGVLVGEGVRVGVAVRVAVGVAGVLVGVAVLGAGLKLAKVTPDLAGAAIAEGPHEFTPGLLSMPYGRRPFVLITEPAHARACAPTSGAIVNPKKREKNVRVA